MLDGFTITVRTSAKPGRAELLAILDALAWSNARWYLEQWELGKDPPCCNDCAHLRYVPDRPSKSLTFRGGDDLLRSGHGSCGELAALDAGRTRADAMRKGMQARDAAGEAWVDLQLQRSVRTRDGSRDVWHAVVVMADGRTIDPSLNLPSSRASSRSKVGA